MSSLARRCCAEMLGTGLLVYFGAGAAAMTLMIAAGTDTASSFNIGIGALGGLADWLAIGMAFAIVIAAAIYALGSVSGAHLNPAVSIALWATKRFPAGDTGAYIISQLVGAAIGSLLFAASAGMDAITIGGLGATVPFPGINHMDRQSLRSLSRDIPADARHHGSSGEQQGTTGICRACDRLTVGGIIDDRQHCERLTEHGPDVRPVSRRLAAWRRQLLGEFSDLCDRSDPRSGCSRVPV